MNQVDEVRDEVRDEGSGEASTCIGTMNALRRTRISGDLGFRTSDLFRDLGFRISDLPARFMGRDSELRRAHPHSTDSHSTSARGISHSLT